MKRLHPLSRLLASCLTLCLLLGGVGAQAQELTIEITQGVQGATPIAVVPLAWQGAGPPPADLADIVSADLARSGRFNPMPPNQYPNRPSDLSQVNFPFFRALGVDYLAVGSLGPAPGGGYQVQIQLADVLQASELLSYRFDIRSNQLRKAGHHIADTIYERITGQPGAFDTRIAYVSALLTPPPPGAPPGTPPATQYTLVVADSDGHNPRVILRSPLPVMSPAWSPDGSRLAYVSFEGRRSQIVVQDVYSGARQTVAAFPGINGAPAWSPDGRRLAMTLSRDGNPEIYVMELASGALRRITDNSAIDTEAVWSPDGADLIFTSDRGGGPQLYRVDAGGGRAERLTFEGDYNARASFAPDGRSLALVHRRNGRFHIASLDLASRQLQLLTDGGGDESPSYAPNGQMIIYATSRRGQDLLAVVSADGRVTGNLGTPGSEVRDPAWAPYLR